MKYKIRDLMNISTWYLILKPTFTWSQEKIPKHKQNMFVPSIELLGAFSLGIRDWSLERLLSQQSHIFLKYKLSHHGSSLSQGVYFLPVGRKVIANI